MEQTNNSAFLVFFAYDSTWMADLPEVKRKSTVWPALGIRVGAIQAQKTAVLINCNVMYIVLSVTHCHSMSSMPVVDTWLSNSMHCIKSGLHSHI